MTPQKPAHRVRTIDLETVSGTAELLEQTQIVEGGADEHELHVELLSCLAPHLVCPEEHAMRMVDQNRRAEFSQKAGRLTSHFCVGNSLLHMLKLGRRGWHGKDGLGAAKRWRLCERRPDSLSTQPSIDCKRPRRRQRRF